MKTFEQHYAEQGVTEQQLASAYRSYALQACLFGGAAVVFLACTFLIGTAQTHVLFFANTLFFVALWLNAARQAYVRAHRTLAWRGVLSSPRDWFPSPFLKFGARIIDARGQVLDVQLLPRETNKRLK